MIQRVQFDVYTVQSEMYDVQFEVKTLYYMMS